MFLNKGLHFLSIKHMLMFVLCDESYAMCSVEYMTGAANSGNFKCTNKESLALLNQLYAEFGDMSDFEPA